MLDFDSVLLEIGERGRYQQLMYFLLCIPATLPAAFIAFNQVFITATPDHWCRVPQLANLSLARRQELLPHEEDGSLSSCQMYDVNYTDLWVRGGLDWPEDANASWPVIACRHGWEYDTTYYDETFTTKFDLVCDKKWLPDLCTNLFYTGSAVGNVLFGWVADRWGRRTSIVVVLALEIPFSILTAFSANYTMFAVIRFIVGLSFPALFQIPFILALEMMGPSYRTFAGMIICIFFAGSMALLAAIAYLCRHWFVLALSLSVPFVTLISYWWIIPESPRWLIQQGRVEEAEEIVQRMAKVNKKPIPTNYLKSKMAVNESAENAVPAKTVSMRVIFFGFPNIRKKFLIITFTWTVNAIVYNGLSYNSSNLGVSDYLAFFISAVVEVPSYLIVLYTMDRCGRRWSLCATMLLGGLACISCILVPTGDKWVTVALTMISKFGIAGSFAVIYVFAGELLPTVIRSQAMALASFFSGLGLICFPQILALKAYGRVLPLVVFGVLTLLATLVSAFLPDTAHQHLPETMEEGERFGGGGMAGPLSCCRQSREKRQEDAGDAEAPCEMVPLAKQRPYNGFTELEKPAGPAS